LKKGDAYIFDPFALDHGSLPLRDLFPTIEEDVVDDDFEMVAHADAQKEKDSWVVDGMGGGDGQQHQVIRITGSDDPDDDGKPVDTPTRESLELRVGLVVSEDAFRRLFPLFPIDSSAAITKV